MAAPPADASKTDDDFGQKAREAGWTEKVAFDYQEYERTAADNIEWRGMAKVYEWKDEYGEVGPEIPELEKILFGGEFRMQEGSHRDALELEVKSEGPTRVAPVFKFEEAGLHPVVLRNLELANYKTATPIQAYTIPAVLQGMDVVAVAQTGSGKTAAYLVPIISKLMGKAKKLQAPRPDATSRGYDPSRHRVRAEPLVVIVVPTRELAVQVFDEARRMCYRSMLRPCVAYGGFDMRAMFEQLGAGCDILISTPGRLCDIMDKPTAFTMSRVKYTVIDEADEMLNSDWEESLSKIMSGGDTNEDADHVYMMFSATFPKGARELAREYMANDYFRVRVGRAGQSHKNIRQNIIYVDHDQKRQAVFDLLFQMEPARTMIFCNTKAQVDLLDDFLYNRQLPTTSIHADRAQREREDAMRAFRTGRAPILIATGISARGWDIPDVKHVINYDLPSTTHGGIQEYIHRIGRTARIGHQGLATSFYNDRNEDLAQDLVNTLIECACQVPDFLQHLVPEGGQPTFDDDTDDEEAGDKPSADAGAEDTSAEPAAEANGNGGGWGAPAEAPSTAFVPDASAGPAASW